MQLSTLLIKNDQSPRFLIYYFHLLNLHATTLLYQRFMHYFVNEQPPVADDPIFQVACTVGREGVTATEQAVRLIGLITSERLQRKSWICILSAYTSGVVILHRAYLQILDGISIAHIVDDIAIATQVIDALYQFSRVASFGQKLYEVLHPYLHILKQHAQNEDVIFTAASPSLEYGALDFPFRIPIDGTSDLHKGARDLARILCRPFGSTVDEHARAPASAPSALLNQESALVPPHLPRQVGGKKPGSWAMVPESFEPGDLVSNSEPIILKWVDDMLSWYAVKLELHLAIDDMDKS